MYNIINMVILHIHSAYMNRIWYPRCSLKGSPTVSPCTAASCASLALGAASFSSCVLGFFVYRSSMSSEKPFLRL